MPKDGLTYIRCWPVGFLQHLYNLDIICIRVIENRNFYCLHFGGFNTKFNSKIYKAFILLLNIVNIELSVGNSRFQKEFSGKFFLAQNYLVLALTRLPVHLVFL